MRSRSLLVASAFATLVSFVAPGHAAPAAARYVAGGTAVVKQGGQPAAVDNGAVVCNGATGAGVGGGCVGFGAFVGVTDAASGTQVAFQVCVDNNGDGRCTSPDRSPFCPDQIFFSHDDNGAFFNPLGPLPGGFKPGCPGGPWRGYVVFLCTGVHVTAAGAHSHPATTGTIALSPTGSGFGTFCGGADQNPSSKTYVVT